MFYFIELETMMEEKQTKIRQISKSIIPFLIFSAIISALAGSFFGRVNTISCNKKDNTCFIVSKGYLYTVYREQIAFNEIVTSNVQLIRDEAPKTYTRTKYGAVNRPPFDYYSLIIERGIEKPLKIIPNVEVPVHDIFNYSIPIFEASDSLNFFLNSPIQNKLTLKFGTHRTGYFFTLVIFGFFAYWLFSRFFWQMSYRISNDRVTKGFMEGSDSDEFIDRKAFTINIKRGTSDVYNCIIYLIPGSLITIEKYIMVKHSFSKKPERVSNFELPKNIPKQFKEEIMDFKA